MKRGSILILLALVGALSGCDRWQAEPVGQSRYQLVVTTDGRVYRLDAKTGAVHFVSPEKMLALPEAFPKLTVGSYYEMADAATREKFLKYLGNGQFEKSAWAVRESP